MSQSEFTFSTVASQRQKEALELLFEDMSEPSRTAQVQQALDSLAQSPLHAAGLLEAWHGQHLVATSWLQLLPGRVGYLWGPQFVSSPSTRKTTLQSNDSQLIASELTQASLTLAQQAGCQIVQSLVAPADLDIAAGMQQAGMTHATDLHYLISMRGTFPQRQEPSELTFEAFQSEDEARWERIIEQTYEESLDCPLVNGTRTVSELLASYLSTGDSGATHWYFVRQDGRDIGCLLLAEHRRDACWELVYMGIIPQERGRGLGRQIVRHAQWLARQHQAMQLALAVDAENQPARAMYMGADFVACEVRKVMLFFPHESS